MQAEDMRNLNALVERVDTNAIVHFPNRTLTALALYECSSVSPNDLNESELAAVLAMLRERGWR